MAGRSACFAAEHGLEHRPPAIEQATLDLTDDLVARDEGKADDVLEIARAPPVQSREVGSADARQARVQLDPSRTRELERVDLDKLRRPEANAFAGTCERGGDRARQSAAGFARTGALSSAVSVRGVREPGCRPLSVLREAGRYRERAPRATGRRVPSAR